jgi:hypothetical protein
MTPRTQQIGPCANWVVVVMFQVKIFQPMDCNKWLGSYDKISVFFNKIFPDYQPCQLVKRQKKPFQEPFLSLSSGYWCIWNQPTKKLTKGGVLHKRNTLSLARLNHSCVRNAELELEKEP